MVTANERLATVEVEIKNIENKLDRHTIEQREDFDKLHAKLDSLDGKFASKWVEKISIGILITLIGTIISMVI